MKPDFGSWQSPDISRSHLYRYHCLEPTNRNISRVHCIGIPIIMMRMSWNHLIFIIGFPILVQMVFFILKPTRFSITNALEIPQCHTKPLKWSPVTVYILLTYTMEHEGCGHRVDKYISVHIWGRGDVCRICPWNTGSENNKNVRM